MRMPWCQTIPLTIITRSGLRGKIVIRLINRLFLVEKDTASVTTSVYNYDDHEDLTVSLNGSGTFAYFTAWGMPGTENFTNEEMQAFFEQVVDNVVLNDDGSTASYTQALENFEANSLTISLGLPSNYPIQEILLHIQTIQDHSCRRKLRAACGGCAFRK